MKIHRLLMLNAPFIFSQTATETSGESTSATTTTTTTFVPGMCFKSMTPKPVPTSAPKPILPSQPTPSGNWAQDCLAAHNYYRKLDGLPPLFWDQTLSAKATNQAHRLAASGFQLKHDGMGENLNRSSRDSCSHSVFVWYEEKYAAGFQKYGTRGHYFQLSSKIATRVGCGVASQGITNMISCKYDRAF